MLDFYALEDLLTPEEKEVQKAARRFLEKEALPHIRDWWEEGVFPTHLIPRFAELGFLGPTLPPEYGGAGVSSAAYGLICYELERVDSGLRSFVSVQSSLVMYPIYAYGSEEQKREFLPKLARGEMVGCFGLTEPDGGSDPYGNMKTRARREGDTWVLNGTKMWISNGGEAEWVVVFATVNPELRHKGVVALVVERGTPGFKAIKIHGKMGQRASGTYELVFEDVKVPVENRLGEEGEGFKIAMQTLNKTRIPVAAGSVGVARRALDEARKYAKERQAFGQPIANFQAIQFKLADMLIGIETARMYTYYAAWLADQGLPHAHASAIAKAYASEIAFEAANQAIQIHGGYGYVREFPVEKLLRDVKLNQIYEGTNEIQRLIIARHILAE